MPTYEYECDGCGHRFELFQQMSDRLVRKCPKCKKPRARRLIGPGAGLIFKGSGFYTTDYRSEDYKRQAKADSEAPKPSSETKSETPKSAAPKPDKPSGEKPSKRSRKKSD